MAATKERLCTVLLGWCLLSTITANTSPHTPASQDVQSTPSPQDVYALQNVTTLPPPRHEPRSDDSRGSDDSRDGSRDDSRRHRRRNRRCKCIKRFMKEVDQLIDERLEDFENKYLRQVNLDKERALALQNEASSTASRIQGLDKMMLVLNSEARQTKEALSLMSTNLEVLRYEMNHTRGDVRFLNESFRVLDGAVDNLSRFVNRVERMIPAGLTRPSLVEVEDDPKQSYPRRSHSPHPADFPPVLTRTQHRDVTVKRLLPGQRTILWRSDDTGARGRGRYC